jgi:hypothetical protein
MKQSSGQAAASDAAPQSLLARAVTSGTIGGLAAAAAASLAGKREDRSYAAPLNATSHIIWGDEAARQDQPSLKYTLTGFLLNHASAIFWALFYEKLLGKGEKRQSWHHPKNWNEGARPQQATPARTEAAILKPILDSAAVTAGAYLIDYHLIPQRFTPGFEKRLSGKSLAAVFVALAAGLAARDMMQAAKARRNPA